MLNKLDEVMSEIRSSEERLVNVNPEYASAGSAIIAGLCPCREECRRHATVRQNHQHQVKGATDVDGRM
jgi:hypothetical protein